MRLEGTISKTQRRKLQKKRAKEAAASAREVAARERAMLKATRAELKAAATPVAHEPHPIPQPLTFAAEEDDHCETAPEAYSHIAELLHLTARSLGVQPESLRIYDPYFCNGAVVRHLGALGFLSVHNHNHDCYAVWAAGTTPEHDVVITNPPYSSSHPRRMLEFLVANGKPWLACMPNWISAKDYYEPLLNGMDTFYIVPGKHCGSRIPTQSCMPRSRSGQRHTHP